MKGSNQDPAGNFHPASQSAIRLTGKRERPQSEVPGRHPAKSMEDPGKSLALPCRARESS